MVGVNHASILSPCFPHPVKLMSNPELLRPLISLRGNNFFGILGRRRERNTVNEHRWHRPFGFDAQIADALPDRKCIAFPCREPFYCLVVSG